MYEAARYLAHAIERGSNLNQGAHHVAIGGPSAIGKSTLARAVKEILVVDSTAKVSLLELDGFMMSRSVRRKLHLSGYDPTAHDLATASRVIDDLLGGREANVPIYDHRTGAHAFMHRMAPVQVLVVEGVQALHHKLLRADTIRIEITASLLVRIFLRWKDDVRRRNISWPRAAVHTIRETWAHHLQSKKRAGDSPAITIRRLLFSRYRVVMDKRARS